MGTKGRFRLGAPASLLTVLMLVLAVLAAGFMGDFSADPVVDPSSAVEQERTPAPTAPATSEPLPDGERLEIGGDWAVAALLLLVTAGLALLVRFLLRLRTRRTVEEGPLERTDLQRQDLPALASDALPAWTADSHALLAEGTDTSDAVIRCWLAFEQLCTAAGTGRTPAQTTTDFATAAAAALGLPVRPLATLTRLYQRARFGRAGTPLPLDDGDRDLATAAIGELAAALRARRTAAGAG